MNHLEQQSSSSSTSSRRSPVQPEIQHGSTPSNNTLGKNQACSDGGIETSSSKSTNSVGAAHDAHSDRKAVVVVVLLHGAGNVENNGDEGEGVDAFGEHSAEDGFGAADGDFGSGLCGAATHEENTEESASETTSALGDDVADGVFEANHVAEEDTESDGGVDVGAGDVAESEDEDGEGETDGDGSEISELEFGVEFLVAHVCFSKENCKNENEGSCTFDEILKLI